MSIYDGSASTQGFDMTSATLVDWASLGNALSSNYSYFTDDGHDIDLFDTMGGGALTYDGSDNPTGGNVTNGQIDFNDDDFANPDIVFTADFDLVTMTNAGASGNTTAFYDEILGLSDDIVGGSAFVDTLIGLGGADTLKGLGGSDSLDGGDGADTLQGGDGDDILKGGLGSDALDGEGGNDFADFSDVAAPVTVDLALQTVSTGDTIAGIEGAFGSDGSNDTMTGSAGANGLKGLGGADVLSGGDGNDTIGGGDDNDRINGGKGFDLISGDDGNDNIKGGAVSDTLKGLGGDDVLAGGGGIDFLTGGDGIDDLRGNLGTDNLDGGNDNDKVAGRGGADTLNGGDGDDRLTGKGGADVYVFELGGDNDTIRSFSAGAGGSDIIQILGFGAAFDSFDDVLAAATDSGVNTTIDLGGGDTLLIKGVVVADLDASDFLFI